MTRSSEGTRQTRRSCDCPLLPHSWKDQSTGKLSPALRLCIAEDVDFIHQAEIDRLERKVRCRVTGSVRNFRLQVHADGLILLGHASTYYAKQLAQHAIMAATIVPILANEIEVISACCEPQA